MLYLSKQTRRTLLDAFWTLIGVMLFIKIGWGLVFAFLIVFAIICWARNDIYEKKMATYKSCVGDVIEAIEAKLHFKKVTKIYWDMQKFDVPNADVVIKALELDYTLIQGLKKKPYKKGEVVISFGTQYGCPLAEEARKTDLLVLGFSGHNKTFGKASWYSPT